MAMGYRVKYLEGLKKMIAGRAVTAINQLWNW
jgi:hypothetical protein